MALSYSITVEPLIHSREARKPSALPGHGDESAVRVFLQHGIPRGSGSLADYERGKQLVSRMAHGDPAAYQQFLKVLVKYVGV